MSDLVSILIHQEALEAGALRELISGYHRVITANVSQDYTFANCWENLRVCTIVAFGRLVLPLLVAGHGRFEHLLIRLRQFPSGRFLFSCSEESGKLTKLSRRFFDGSVSSHIAECVQFASELRGGRAF